MTHQNTSQFITAQEGTQKENRISSISPVKTSY
jgi:hypothetical protein